MVPTATNLQRLGTAAEWRILRGRSALRSVLWMAKSRANPGRKAIKPSIGSHMNAVELRTIAKVTRRLPLEAPVLWRAQFDSSHDGHDSFRTRFCGATRPADVGRALLGPVFPVQVQPRHLISLRSPL